MTNQEQQQYLMKWGRFQQKYEKLFEKKFAKALKLQLEAFIKYKDIMMIPSFPIYDVLLQLYKTVGPAWARTTRTEIKKATGQMGFNEEIVALMNQYYGIDLLNDAEGITSYTRALIQKVLSDAAMTGASFDDIVKILTSSSELGAMRARRIARTETVTAANGAAMIYAQRSGNKMEKIWISVKDKRTRHTAWANHVEIDGKTVPIEEAFKLRSQKLGDIYMMQPGVRQQPNGLPVPPAEIVNCRCVVGFRAMRDRNGRIIRNV
jgi:uncharacterized protein with gpF-like domain